MAFKIVENCINCCACEAVCPTGAIFVDQISEHFAINEKQCTECLGDFAEAQCASICPVEGAILDGFGVPVNPPGTLTGIRCKSPV